MALWQYTFHVLPKESLETFSSNPSFNDNEEGLDDKPFWELASVERSFFYGVSNILPKGKSWSDSIDLYGNQESNCFEVLSENNKVISVSFRIDFTSKYDHVLNQLIEYCMVNSLIILDENLSILLLNCKTIETIIEGSPQVVKYRKLLS